METSAGHALPRELYGIQMLRGLAAVMVVAHHVLEVAKQDGALDSPNWLVTAGAAGVDIFFVVSGIIMIHTSFREGRPSVRSDAFFSRRITRIFPLYWLSCAAVVVLAHLRHADADPLSGSVPALFLLPGDTPIIPYSWTLSYELYFYVIFALALLSRTLSRTVTITIAAMIAIGLLAATMASGTWADFLTDPIPVEFVFGMALILALRRCARHGRRWPFRPVFALPAAAAMCLAPLVVAHVGTVGLPGWSRVGAWGLPAAVIVATFLTVGPPRTALQRLAVKFGDASYAVYLTHLFAMIGYRYALKSPAIRGTSQLLVAPVMFLLACGLGVLVHVMIELPLTKGIRRLGILRRRPLSASA